MARATSSLPVPVSPRMSTVEPRHARRFDETEDVLHRRRRADQIGMAVVAHDLAAENRHAVLQRALRGADLLVQTSILDRDRHVLRQGVEKAQVVVRERRHARAAQLQAADDAALRAQRSGEQAARDHARLHVDTAVPALVLRDVVDELRLAVLYNPPGDAARHRQTDVAQASIHFRPSFGGIWKEQLLLLRIEQQHRTAVGAHRLICLAHDQRHQLLQLHETAERAAHVVEEL